MTNLSKQIFECCGIEPVYKYTFQAFKKESIHHGWGKANFVKYFNMLSKGFDGFKKYYKFIKVEKKFPDLETNANNFVRLYELPIAQMNTLGLLFVRNFKFRNRKEFLTYLYMELKNDKSYVASCGGEDSDIFKYKEKIKQAIANEQWEW